MRNTFQEEKSEGSQKRTSEMLAKFDSNHMSLRLHEVKQNKDDLINYLSIGIKNSPEKAELNKLKETILSDLGRDRSKFSPPNLLRQSNEASQQNSFSRQVLNHQREITRLKHLCENYQESNARLIKESEENIGKFEQHMRQMDLLLKQKQEQIQELERATRHHQEVKKNQSKQIEKIKAQKELLKKELKNAKQAQAAAKERLTAFALSNDERNKFNCQDMNRRVKQLQQEKGEIKEQLSKQMNKRTALEKTLDTKEAQIREKAESMNRLSRQIQELRTQRENWHSQRNPSEQMRQPPVVQASKYSDKEVEFLKDRIVFLQNSQAQLTNHILQCKNKNEGAPTGLELKITAMLEEKDSKINLLEKENRALTREVSQITIALSSYKYHLPSSPERLSRATHTPRAQAHPSKMSKHFTFNQINFPISERTQSYEANQEELIERLQFSPRVNKLKKAISRVQGYQCSMEVIDSLNQQAKVIKKLEHRLDQVSQDRSKRSSRAEQSRAYTQQDSDGYSEDSSLYQRQERECIQRKQQNGKISRQVFSRHSKKSQKTDSNDCYKTAENFKPKIFNSTHLKCDEEGIDVGYLQDSQSIRHKYR